MIERPSLLTLMLRDAAGFLLIPLGLALGGALAWPVAGLMAVRAASAGEIGAMLLWYGVALGFDPQALLIGPFVAALAIGRRAAPSSLVLAILAAAGTVLARAAIGDLSAVPFPLDLPLSRGAPNLWSPLHAVPGIDALPLIGLALGASVGVAGAYIARFSAQRLYRSATADAALLCALVMAAVLPATDATIAMVPTALAVTLAAQRTCDPVRWQIALLVVAAGLLALLPAPGATPLGAVALLIATFLQARAVLQPAANDNPLMPRTV